MSHPNTDVLDEILGDIIEAYGSDRKYPNTIIQAAKQKIQQLYILKSDVEEAIGKKEYHKDSSFGGVIPDFETPPMKYRNEFRDEIRTKLGLINRKDQNEQ